MLEPLNAVRELVALKRLQDRIEAAEAAHQNFVGDVALPIVFDEYNARKVVAWAAAFELADTNLSRESIDMVLFCPKCGMQHIDRSDVDKVPVRLQGLAWDNPPHRSHLCRGCGHIWRPADVPTNGVEAVKTKGANDSPLVAPATARAISLETIAEWRAERGRGMCSAIGEYTPAEFWTLLDAYEAIAYGDCGHLKGQAVGDGRSAPTQPVAMIEPADARKLADELEKLRCDHWTRWSAQENHIAATAVRHLRLLGEQTK